MKDLKKYIEFKNLYILPLLNWFIFNIYFLYSLFFCYVNFVIGLDSIENISIFHKNKILYDF